MATSPFLITPGTRVRLHDFDPSSFGPFTNQAQAEAHCEKLREELVRQQDMLFAREEQAVLMIFQGMDGAGKDGTIKSVSSLLDPQSCHALALKEAAGRELKHDYLRRYVAMLPVRGQIGIFNRSYYESVLAPQVYPKRLAEENLPAHIMESPELWNERYRQINNFERYLTENGFLILKFFLHLSREKQRERFLERLEEPDKNWKFSSSDMRDRSNWDRFQEVYEDVLTETSTEHAPWRIIPADHRWVSSVCVTQILLEGLQSLNLAYPEPDKETREQMDEALAKLSQEKGEE